MNCIIRESAEKFCTHACKINENNHRKLSWWYVEVTFSLYTHAQFQGLAFIQCLFISVTIETCLSDMSIRVKQRAVIEFLTAEKVTPTEIHRHLKAVYGNDAIDRTTVNRWVIKFRGCKPGKAIIVDEKRSGRPITVTDDEHRKLVDDLIQNDRRITQQRIANHIGIAKERVCFIIEQLEYRKRQ